MSKKVKSKAKPSAARKSKRAVKTKGAKTAAAAKSADGDPVGKSFVVRPGSKLETIVKMLKQPNGCSAKEVLAATGWPAVSMPQQARAAGLTLSKQKVDGVTRYSVA